MRYSVIFLISFFTLIACKEGNSNKHENGIDNNVAHSSSQKDHWSYAGETGPEHWAEIEEESDCSGKFQSPINIVKYKENNVWNQLI